MTRRKWKLTRVGEEPDIDEWGDEFEDRRRSSLLAELAKDPTTELVEIAPGVYRGPKSP